MYTVVFVYCSYSNPIPSTICLELCALVVGLWLSPHLLPRSDSNSSSINTILLSVDVDVNIDVIVEAIR